MRGKFTDYAWVLRGKCGRILSVATPAASEQGPRDQLRRDAVEPIVMVDGVVRMRRAKHEPQQPAS